MSTSCDKCAESDSLSSYQTYVVAYIAAYTCALNNAGTLSQIPN